MDVHTFLVGEAFMRADDPGVELARMFFYHGASVASEADHGHRTRNQAGAAARQAQTTTIAHASSRAPEREGTPIELANVYFDTPRLALANAKSALRLRRTPDGWLQTYKTVGQVRMPACTAGTNGKCR